MSQAFLRGRDHHRLGAIELIGEGACALALSRGGSKKTYSHTEPNEDACAFHRGTAGVLLAVADGHGGAGGAEIALATLLDRYAPRWTSEPAPEADALTSEIHEALCEAARAIAAEGARNQLPPAPTTLSLALLRADADRLTHASIGDSHIYCARGAQVEDLGWAARDDTNAHYLGDPRHDLVSDRHCIAHEKSSDVRALLLVTDGFSERRIGVADPLAAAEAIFGRHLDATPDPTSRRPVEICRDTTELALRAHRKNRAGDNVACAVWVAGSEGVE